MIDNLLRAASDFRINNNFELFSMFSIKCNTRASLSYFTLSLPATFGHLRANYVMTFNRSIYISIFAVFTLRSSLILWTNKSEITIPSYSGA